MLFGLGAAIARATGHGLDLRRYLLGQAAVTAFQLMTHYANDYYDFEADLANQTPTRWSGGSRVLPAGALPRKVALIAALVLAAIGVALTVVLSGDAGRFTALTFAVVLILAWSYSAPPLRLCATGFGELTTAIVVTGLVPWLGFYLQAPDLRGADLVLLSSAPLALLQLAMLLAIELPDAASDAATGKHTLVVRLGGERSSRLYVVITVAAYASLPIAWLLGVPTSVVLAAAMTAPLALWRVVRIGDHANPAAHEQMTLFAVMLLVATSAAELAAWLMVQ